MKYIPLTLTVYGIIIKFMKRIPTQENSIGKRILINIPFVLLVIFMVAAFGGGGLLLFYSFVCLAAFNSAMIFLIVFGAAAILVGAGLALIVGYKKYYAFYNKKMGWKFVEDENKPPRTITTTGNETIKKLFTLPNISLAFLALGSLFAIISAALGCINRQNWVDALGGFKENLGYYADVKYVSNLQYPINGFDANTTPINAIVVDESSVTYEPRTKEIVIIYSEDTNPYISISGYQKFDGDFEIYRATDGTLTIHVGDAPKRDQTIEKLLFFVFNDYIVEKQIIIKIPESYRDSIEIPEDSMVLEEKDMK